MAGIALFQALDNISPGYGNEYAELFHQAGFPDPLALGTLRETDAPEVPLGVRRVVIGRLGEVNTDIFPFRDYSVELMRYFSTLTFSHSTCRAGGRWQRWQWWR